MRTKIIACLMIENELNLAIKETECKFPVIWMDAGLHINPEILRKSLQQELDRIEDTDQVILSYGYCGNALIGLKTNNFRMIFPRVDDCVTLVLGSCAKRNEISREMATYFLTKGWLDSSKSMWTEYQDTVKRYGKERADRIMAALYKNYKRLGIIDTGAYDVSEIMDTSRKIAKELKLKHQIIPGTVDYMKKLLTGPWDNQFIIVEPGNTITMQMVYGDNQQAVNC